MSIDPGLDEAVDCLVELYDASRNAGIDAIRAKEGAAPSSMKFVSPVLAEIPWQGQGNDLPMHS